MLPTLEPLDRVAGSHVIDIEVGGGSTVRRREPVRVGIPLARGFCTESSWVHLVDAADRRQLVQAKVLDRWSDGSIRWLLVDFLADFRGTENRYRLSFDAGEATSAPALSAAAGRDEISIDSGPARFRLRS